MSYTYSPNENITIFDAAVYVDGVYAGVTDEAPINYNTETKDFKDSRGRKLQSIPLVSEVSGSIKCRDASIQNMVFATQANETSVEAGDNSVEVLLTPGKSVILPHVNVSNVVVTPAGGGAALVVDVAYEVNGAHGVITPLSGLTTATTATVAYDYADQVHLGMLRGTNPVKRIEYLVTRLHDGSAFRVGIFKAKFKPTKQLALAGNDYVALDLEWEGLARTGAPLDAYLGDFGYVMATL